MTNLAALGFAELIALAFLIGIMLIYRRLWTPREWFRWALVIWWVIVLTALALSILR